MGFQMSYTKEELNGPPPVPAGWYTIQLKNFRPKVAGANKDSASLNAELEIISNPEYEKRKVWASLNSKAPWILFDFVHACGLEMEVVNDQYAGTEKESQTLPGVFEGSNAHPDEPEKWKYQGPLTNKTLEVELAETEYQGKKRNEIRQFKCAVQGCTEKHSTNLIKS